MRCWVAACRNAVLHFNRKEEKHRIVSIDRPYIRPIVRGKENIITFLERKL